VYTQKQKCKSIYMRKRFWQKKGPINCGDGKLRKWTEATMAKLEKEYENVST
jgi:hypothetical protein